MFKHSKNKELLFAVAAVLLAVGVAVLAWVSSSEPKPTEPVYCTQDAKICPDGSYVGRIGPKCEFAPCPGTR